MASGGRKRGGADVGDGKGGRKRGRADDGDTKGGRKRRSEEAPGPDDEVQAQGPRMAVESKPNPRSCTGPGTPGTGERPQLALKRQRTSALSGAVRVVEGTHAGATGDVLDAASGYYRVALHGPGGKVVHFRSVQLVAIAAAAPGSDGDRVSGRGGGSGSDVTAAAAGAGGRAGGGGGGGGGRDGPSCLQPSSPPCRATSPPASRGSRSRRATARRRSSRSASPTGTSTASTPYDGMASRLCTRRASPVL